MSRTFVRPDDGEGVTVTIAGETYYVMPATANLLHSIILDEIEEGER